MVNIDNITFFPCVGGGLGQEGRNEAGCLKMVRGAGGFSPWAVGCGVRYRSRCFGRTYFSGFSVSENRFHGGRAGLVQSIAVRCVRLRCCMPALFAGAVERVSPAQRELCSTASRGPGGL